MPEKTKDGVELIQSRPVFHLGRWISAIIVGLLALGLAYILVTNPQFRWDVVWKWLFSKMIITGLMMTIVLTVLSMALGTVLAITMAIMRQSINPVLRGVASAYIWFFRGTPIYTQLVFWGLLPTLYNKLSLGIPFGPEFFTFSTKELFTGAFAAILGLGLNEGAYLSEIVRSGIDSVDKGQTEAAQALGMSKGQTLRRIVLPQAMRVIVPPTGNETISMLKTTSLVLAVPFTKELTFVANAAGTRLFLPIPLLIVAAIWYLLITSIWMVFQHYIERYYGRGFAPDSGKKLRNTSKRQQAIIRSGTTPAKPVDKILP